MPMMIYSIYWITRAHCLLSNNMRILLYVYVHSNINNNLIYYIVLLFLLSPFTLCTFRCRRCLAAFILVIFNTYRLPRPCSRHYHHPSFHQQHPLSTTINIALPSWTNNRQRLTTLPTAPVATRPSSSMSKPIIDRCGVHVDGDSFLPKREVEVR